MSTRITRVTVYRNGALVVRRGRAEPGAVEVTGLPLLYASDSLRLRPETGQVRDVRETCALVAGGATEPSSDHILEQRRLEVATEALRDERERLDGRIRAYQGLSASPAKRTPRQLPGAGALLELHDFASKKLESLEAKRANLEAHAETLRKARRALARVLHGDRVPPRFTRGVRFHLEGDEATHFELEYFVEAARWVPTYVFDLKGRAATIRLEAMVAQASGEDWSGVAVQVSTADLTREATLPELSSWRIGTAQPRPKPAFRPLPDGLDALFAGYDRVGPSPAIEPTAGAAAPPPPPPMQPAPMPAAAHAPPPAPSPANKVAKSAIYDTLDEEVGGVEMGPPSTTLTGAYPAEMPMQTLSASAPMRRSRGGFGGGGAPPPQAVGGRIRPPDGEIQRRLRYAYLRLEGPDSPHRGTLRPVDPLAHLWSLVEDHEAADRPALQRAIQALQAGRDRMRHAPLPKGTHPPKGYHQLYAAEGGHDLPGDGGWHRVVVLDATAPAAIEYRTVPRESHDVFRFCRVRPPEGLPLPRGPMQVYIDGAFRVTATMQGSGGGEPLDLNLGLEPAVRVVERKAHANQQDKGIVSHTTRVDHSVVVRVRSSLGEAATLHVYDRLPVADDDVKDVKVTLLESTPAAQETDRAPSGDPLEGGLRWTVEMAPGAVSNLAWQYRVELPAKQEIVGGNRRE